MVHVPAGQARLDLLLALYAMFGVSLMASLVTIPLIWGRLLHYGPGPRRLVPTLWIVLGPLGQSITAANLLGAAAPHAIHGGDATLLRAFGLVYGVPTWGVRDALAEPRRRGDREHRPPRPAVQPGLVELHVPGGHHGHRDVADGDPCRIAGPRLGRRVAVPPFRRSLAHRAWHGALGHAITAAGSDRPALGKHTTVEL